MILLRLHNKETEGKNSLASTIQHSFTNGSVLLILGSLLIGLIADSKQAEGIKPFTTDIFKGFLAIFLLEMGMVTARRFASFRQYGLFLSLFALIIPAVNGSIVAYASSMVTSDPGNRFMFAILAASASYIAVPAAMKIAAPRRTRVYIYPWHWVLHFLSTLQQAFLFIMPSSIIFSGIVLV